MPSDVSCQVWWRPSKPAGDTGWARRKHWTWTWPPQWIFGFRPSEQPRYPWTRLDTVLDGIFAIAATVLVLDLHVIQGDMATYPEKS